MDIKIIVATHKQYEMPADPMYIPLHVGAEGKPDLGYLKDNTGDNISTKNKNYCELTGLYYMWKNMTADYKGLVHYRRHFVSLTAKGSKSDRIISSAELSEILKTTDIIVPKKRHYYIETNYSQYAHAHHHEDLDETRKIIEERYPDFIPSYDEVMKRTYGHRFNMFIMKSEVLDEYLTWMFDILFELEKRVDISNYSANDARIFGFVSERLLDVWLEKTGYAYRELPYEFMEKQNWLVKGSKFLLRKMGKKTEP